MRSWGVVATVMLVLSGCAGEKETSKDDPLVTAESFDDFELEAVEARFGVIRGVVVDAALTPLSNVFVELLDQARNTTTNGAGLFAFKDLAPGTYFLQATLDRYEEAQTSVEVVADVPEPDVVKVRLQRVPGTEPRAVGDIYKGFMTCSVRIPAAGFNDGCGVFGNLGLGSTQRTRVKYDGTNMFWWQGELIWKSSSTTSERLCFSSSEETLAGGVVCGPSPGVQAMNRSLVLSADLEEGSDFELVAYPDHYAGGVSGNLVVNQEFQFVHYVFHNFVPPQGWTFFRDGAPVVPA